jgi:hypothetical protein
MTFLRIAIPLPVGRIVLAGLAALIDVVILAGITPDLR